MTEPRSSFFEHRSGQDRSRAAMAAVVHLYHLDLLEPIKGYLARIPIPCDLFVSIANPAHLPIVSREFAAMANRLSVCLLENRGRDIRPFVQLMAKGELDHYPSAIKIHTKKSDYSPLGTSWRDILIDALLPSEAGVAQVVQRFQDDPGLGLAAPFASYISAERHWGSNRNRVLRFAERMGLAPAQRELFFVAGSMFWFRPLALSPLVAALRDEPFEDELGQQDGTLAHAVERLTCLSAWSAGTRCSATENLELVLMPSDTAGNKVALLDGG